MNELIKVEINKNHEQIVSARLLYKYLEVKSRFNDWINNRIDKYGFIEGEYYTKILVQRISRVVEQYDYFIKIDMAKELSMIENNEKGSIARKYFIQCMDKWNSSKMILIKADQIKSKMIDNYQKEIKKIILELEYKNEVIKGVTENIDVYKKQVILNRVVKHKGANFQDCWNELYRVFKETYHRSKGQKRRL